MYGHNGGYIDTTFMYITILQVSLTTSTCLMDDPQLIPQSWVYSSPSARRESLLKHGTNNSHSMRIRSRDVLGGLVRPLYEELLRRSMQWCSAEQCIMISLHIAIVLIRSMSCPDMLSAAHAHHPNPLRSFHNWPVIFRESISNPNINTS